MAAPRDRPEPGGEDGFTIIEVLIAAIVVVLGSLAIFMTFASAIHNVQRSRETQAGISVAQREMERVRVIPYASVALSSTPATSTETTSPRNRLRVNASKTEFDLKRNAEAEWKPVMTTGLVVPETTNTTASDGTQVTVYRYVVCEESAATNASCLAKRIVIDVLPVARANLGTYRHSYYELQSTLVSPAPPES